MLTIKEEIDAMKRVYDYRMRGCLILTISGKATFPVEVQEECTEEEIAAMRKVIEKE